MLTHLFLTGFGIGATIPVFIGTGGGADGKGIYRVDFDAESGALGEVTLAAEVTGPGFLAVDPGKKFLYAVGSPDQRYDPPSSAVTSFRITAEHGLERISQTAVGGLNACHVAVSPDGRTVAVANYGDGVVSTLRVGADGGADELVSTAGTEGGGPNKARQEGPHSHGVYFDDAGKFLFAPDLGTDRVRVFAFDAATSVITENTEAALITAAGAGPRHMAFSPDRKNAYMINELDQTVLTSSFDATSGTLEALGTVSTVPEEIPKGNSTAEIEVHPNGKFVYGSNRGFDTIAVFARDSETGELTPLQQAPCGGKVPRHFKIAPGGKWMIVAHQGSNTLSALPLDPETGKLGEPGPTTACPDPICVLFPDQG